jgi:hypothetical protein
VSISGPLDGVVVADFGRVLAGPYATMLLPTLGGDEQEVLAWLDGVKGIEAIEGAEAVAAIEPSEAVEGARVVR